MLCEGQLISNNTTYSCQNLTDEKFCDECINDSRIICQNNQPFRCLYFSGRFRCDGLTTEETKLCYKCCYYNSKEFHLEHFGKNNFRSFQLYLRSFNWEQKFLNSIFNKINREQRLDLLFYEQFYINSINLSQVISENKLIEQYFLIKQITIKDLIFYLMFPNLF